MGKLFRPELPISPEEVIFQTQSMTTEETGAFLLLLCKAWREDPPGSIPDDDCTLARWTRLAPDRWAECRPRVLATFSPGGASRLYQRELRQRYEALLRRFQARKDAAVIAVEARRKSNVSGNIDTNRTRDVVQSSTIRSPKLNDSPSTPLRECESFSVCDSSSNNGSVSVVTVETPFDQAVREVAERIKRRHPSIRSCGLAEITADLRAIVRKISPVTAKVEKLSEIDLRHAAWCETFEWQKDGGQFAKGLANWLAPTRKRYNDDPPEDDGLAGGLFDDRNIQAMGLAFRGKHK